LTSDQRGEITKGRKEHSDEERGHRLPSQTTWRNQCRPVNFIIVVNHPGKQKWVWSSETEGELAGGR
jgi:hypothetical protein